jgi:hypothetical protein
MFLWLIVLAATVKVTKVTATRKIKQYNHPSENIVWILKESSFASILSLVIQEQKCEPQSGYPYLLAVKKP